VRQPKSFLAAATLDAFGGSVAYRVWLGALTLGVAVGAAGYAYQLDGGLYVTNMTDQVSWGIYIASFTFQVGMADALVMVVVPAYFYGMASFERIVFAGEALALSAVITSLMYVTVDLGRPERAWHLVPFWGSLNFPGSILGWDVVVLAGYFVINSVLVWMAMRSRFHGRAPYKRVYVPLIVLSVGWAISMHAVTAFLYSWLGARPFWNSAIVPARFLASSFVSGPTFLALALRVIHHRGGMAVDDQVFTTLRRIVTVTLLVNLFLFAAEVFTELYGGSLHSASLRYLLFGHHDHIGMRAYIWTALGLEAFATLILLSPLAKRDRAFDVACATAFLGVWLEKGMALVVPGFIPTPLGEFVEYVPSLVEWVVSFGIWCFGLLVFSILVRLGIRVEQGALRAPLGPEAPAASRVTEEEA